MKKALIILLFLSLAISSCAPKAQQGANTKAQKPKVAVGAIGDEPEDFKALNGLSTKLIEAIVNSGKYMAVDRSEDILRQLGKEHVYQRSGRVDSNQIKELGKQFSVQYICIVGSSELKAGEYQLSARLVDVETAEITSMGSELSSLKDTKELMRVAEVLVTKLLGSGSASSAQEKTAPPSVQSGVTPIQKKTAPPSVPSVQGSVSGSVLTDARDGKEYVPPEKTATPPTAPSSAPKVQQGSNTKAQKPKVAVGAIGDEPENSNVLKVLSTQLTKAIVKSGKYTAIDRSEDILKQLGKEHVYQRSVAVDDEQIKKLGKQFGVQYMCIVRSSELKAGKYHLSAGLVDVETAKITSMGSEPSSLADMDELMRAAEALANQLLGRH